MAVEYLLKRILIKNLQSFHVTFDETNIVLGTNSPIVIELDVIQRTINNAREKKKQAYLLIKSRQNLKEVESVTIQEIFVSETQFVPPSR